MVPNRISRYLFFHIKVHIIILYCLDDNVIWINASVKKIVEATGIETTTKFLPMPQKTNLQPISSIKAFTALTRLLFVLNISFRIPSSGFVNAPPGKGRKIHKDILDINHQYTMVNIQRVTVVQRSTIGALNYTCHLQPTSIQSIHMQHI